MGAVYYVGDAIKVMGKLPEKSVDLVLTSPPFLALRSYLPADHPLKSLEGGSQATPGAYIDWLVDVVEACARILAPHGSLCFELGDTYAGSGAGGDYNADGLREGQPAFVGSGKLANYSDARGNPDGMRDTTFSGGNTRTGGGTGWPLAKSLSLIPELFRLTLVYGQNPLTGRQTERWRLRNVIRWVRPNPPVGALGDKFRPATSELMVFCKSARRFFDLDAVREPHKYPDMVDTPVYTTKPAADGSMMFNGKPIMNRGNPAGAPPLDWWNIPPGGYEGAHYAVWPPELCVKPIKAMSPERVCRGCGEPSVRITERTPEYAAARSVIGDFNQRAAGAGSSGSRSVLTAAAGREITTAENITTGWTDCGHDDYRPGLVLDPFAGSGTTLAVATGHGRDAIGIDLDARNYDLALQRVGPFLLELAEM